MKNSKWKKICSCILAVCLLGSLLLSSQISGVFAEKEEEQIATQQEQFEEETTENTGESEETTETIGENDETAADTEEENSPSEDTEESSDKENVDSEQYTEKSGQFDENMEEEEGTTEEDEQAGSGEDTEEDAQNEEDIAMQNLDEPVEEAENGEIVFDLARGSVVFKANKTYEGWNEYGKKITGIHENSNIYIITQSGSGTTSNTVTIETLNMYSKDIERSNKDSVYNINLNNVNIDSSSYLQVPDGEECMGDVTASNYYRTLAQQLEYYQNNRIHTPFFAGDDTISVNLTLYGENVLSAQKGAGATLQYAHYPMGESGNGALTIEGEGELIVNQTESSSVNRGACIGGPMLYKSESKNGRAGNGKLIFKSGTIKAETYTQSYSAAIGGGSCSPAEMPIIFCGSDVTAKSVNTSATIGAGGGSSGIGEAANYIEMKSGKVTVYGPENGVGIGGGTSEQRSGGEAKNIIISGGTVTVYGPTEETYGMIGGGTSSNIGNIQEEKNGGAANITISGGTVIAGSIGGGSTTAQGEKGGNATIVVNGNADIKTNTIGGGKSNSGLGGNASVTVKSGQLRVTETIGGGNSENGNGGDASINISGGTLDCASIGGGNSVSGKPGSVTSTSQKAGVVITGGTLRAGTIGGGTNAKHDIGFATANISGGDIQGQFILANTDQEKQCKFTMTGGTIDNTNLGTGSYQKAQENGGAVYLSDPNGEVKISGGTIKNSTADLGGAVYMEAGEFTLSGEGAIFDCNASQGGAIYMKAGKATVSGGTIGAIINNVSQPNTSDEGAGVYMAGGSLEVSGGRIGYNKAKNGAGAYLQAGNMTVSNGASVEHNSASESGAGTYLAGGSLIVSGGQITANDADTNGGGAYLQAGSLTVTGGQISQNKAQNGAGAYLEAGNLEMNGSGSLLSNTATENGGGAYLQKGTLTLISGSVSSNTAKDGGGSYLSGGNLKIDGGSVSGNTAQNGGGTYLSGGQLLISGGNTSGNIAHINGGGCYLAGGELNISSGTISSNTAQNGAGAYVADSSVRMFGGTFSQNKASKNGGGMYVSSMTKAADVIIRSGKLNNNTAGSDNVSDGMGDGGAIAVISNNTENKDHVIIGLRENHPDLDEVTRGFTPFSYKDDKDNNRQHNHASCPEIKDNQASGNGGGIYMNSSASILDIYCLLEEGNSAAADSTGASIMSEGGTVNIGDVGDDGNGNNTQDAAGNIFIKSMMLVKGGDVKIYGNTENPQFADKILVNIQQNAGSFNDYRFTQVDGEINYKIEYFENFQNSGIFTAMQYDKDADITAMGNMYIHEGYKIIGWNTKADGTGTLYKTGNLIGSKDDHTAWEGKKKTEALTLYAIWEKISYTVEYHPNANQYSGEMNKETFQYAEEKPLSKNKYKVTGKHFTKWNTKADGTGVIYEESYKESKMSNKDGDTIPLYAQWTDCTHKNGDSPGMLSYTASSATTITEICDCGGHTASVKISGADAYYDGTVHKASLSYTGDLLAGLPKITYTYNEDKNSDYGTMPNNTTEPVEVGYYKATITIEGATVSVEYQIKSPADAATIDVQAKHGQYFKDFNGGSSCKVAQDDAFTVQYTIQKLNAGSNTTSDKVYKKAPVLTLSSELPEGTTIIMQTDGSYWYNNTPSKTEIAVTSFIKMGTTSETFSYNTNDIKDEQQYRFIIDFSKVKKDKYLKESLDIGLKYVYANSNEENHETGANNDKEEKATITIERAAVFEVSANGAGCSVQVKNVSDVSDTRWERKNLIGRVIVEATTTEDNSKLPADAKLTVSTTVNNESRTATYSLNAKGEFIIPFSWKNSQDMTFMLNSEQEAEIDKKYNLKGIIYTGSKIDGTEQPLATEDQEKGSAKISLNMPANTAPALKISGIDRVLTQSDKLKVDIDYNEYIDTDKYSIKAIIQKKDGGEYKGNYCEDSIANTGTHEFTLNSTDGAGSYRVWITVANANKQTVLEVPYYFIII